MSQMIGKQSVSFRQCPYILSSGNVAGKKEGEGPLGKCFDMICEDDKFGADSWEMAESTMQKEAAALAMGKAGVKPEDVRYVFAGDLLGQTIATSFGIMNYNIPLFGLYGACSTAGESMSLAAMCVAGGIMPELALALTSKPLQARRSSFDFPWSTEIRDPYLLPGRLQEAEPFYLEQRKAM